MSLQIVPLRDGHLGDAAALVAARYRAEREHTPSLPPRYEHVDSMFPLLRDLAGRAPGVAAIRDGRLAGFLLGLALEEYRGKRSAYSPEWANAADAGDGHEIYRGMYARLSARWVANGCFTHLVTVMAHHSQAIDAWHWLGFGLTAVDAMRDLAPVQGVAADVDVRRARVEDVEQAMALCQALQRHLAAVPTFVAFAEKQGREFHEEWLADPDNVLWLAYHGGEAVACMGLEPSNPTAAYVIRDEKTVSIARAFTKEPVRNRGIGTALLGRSVDRARSAGYERCAVDFEPENVPGARFWLRHFRPVCYSFIRCVDERVAWAHGDRADEDLW
jgi:GNAT superfamily N-acetyltransferase